MEILDGKKISEEILSNISDEVERLRVQNKRIPRLDMIIVGDDYGSIKYVGMKEKTTREVGIEGQIHHLPFSSNTLDIVNLVDSLNRFDGVDGFMVQLPLPEHIDTQLVLNSIAPQKDVDGLTAINLGKLFQKDSSAIPPATPLGIMKLLDVYGIKLFGKHVVILGTSNIIGTPLAAMMLEKNATVSLCNAHTINIQEISSNADILVSATGKALLIKKDFLKPGCVVIDVGSNKHPETGKLVGDVDWEDVKGIPSYITPVPGGVGPMTISCLMLNLMSAYKKNDSRQENTRTN
ncbi:MAG TPA: bifunctional 5,10-methylenetetrahydrofolate dehydrogenase/5,10-methenyltetrahydrofolate cyclohydrolase [Candidatus Dojkabacteria bacterium]|jgi:methylenetetrahydrofolate dehydrogenase (NADP+)/methenyltetrahydrofolate cyclohydrolase|nr:bifunctional 5,10-methylenetetrahydrofolate dehydrogenase/5,10-methenyltetrahydrofolate cyclohydrolase [Candidatus Dojkabacteria bacterium]HQI92406.1 bifunctional 5,10-methylenetetrahydrofolate dehydrogenase/5,10-methenyltetrahydrofolate cyclohydrolase [Candidatus Dojkabacteria bacterium]